MNKRKPVLERDWLPSSSYGNSNTRTAVELLADALIRLDDDVTGVGASLQDQLAAQAEQIIGLRAMVGALTDLLIENQVLRRDDVQRRVDEKRVDLTTPQPLPAPAPGIGGGGPYRGGPVAATPSVRMAACLRCSAQVPAADTHITETGSVCDACWNQQSIG